MNTRLALPYIYPERTIMDIFWDCARDHSKAAADRLAKKMLFDPVDEFFAQVLNPKPSTYLVRYLNRIHGHPTIIKL